MKFKHCLLLICIGIVASACYPAIYYKPDPLTTNPNNTFISGGITVATSQTPFTKVIIGAIKPENDHLRLIIAYQNDGLDRVDVIPDSIKVTLSDTAKTRLTVFPADEYLKKLQNEQNFALIMQGLAAGFNNAQAGYSRSTTTTTTTTSLNGAYRINTSTTTTYDANKVAEANLKSSQEIQRAANENANYNQSANLGVLRTNTLFKGQSISGYVVVNYKQLLYENILIEVPLGNDVHKFTFVPGK